MIVPRRNEWNERTSIAVLFSQYQPFHKGLLDVKPVLCLSKNHVAEPFKNSIGDLLTAVSRQTVHNHYLLLRELQQLFINLIFHKSLLSLALFLLLAHAHPHIGVDNVGVLYRLKRIIGMKEMFVLSSLVEKVLVRTVFFRCCKGKIEPQKYRSFQQELATLFPSPM